MFEHSRGDRFLPFVLCLSVPLPLVAERGLGPLGEQRQPLGPHISLHTQGVPHLCPLPEQC